MIGGSQSILFIGGIICICYISISIGAVIYYNQGGDLQKLKDKVIKKKARSAVSLICSDGNVIYNGKCLKEFSDQECRDDNDVFWKADQIKRKLNVLKLMMIKKEWRFVDLI